MPCRCDDYGPSEYDLLKKDLNAATRAACDMRTILRKHKLESELCAETLLWIKRHDAADAKRIAEETAKGEREKAKRRALNKLTMDERRMLGL